MQIHLLGIPLKGDSVTKHLVPSVAPLPERFWQKVQKGSIDECWPWLGCRDRHGYGRVSTTRKQGPKFAHRIAWRLTFGEPGSQHVLHQCDNPPCCNPNHLFLGTHLDNMRDAVRKGRLKKPPTGRGGTPAVLTKEEVSLVRAWLLEGRSSRSISDEMGVSSSVVDRIRNNQGRFSREEWK